MKKNIFSAILAQACLYFSAMVFISAALASCNKEKYEQNYDNGEIILNSTKGEEEKISLWFAMKDTPKVEGAVETDSKQGADDWAIKTYKLTSNTVKIKGGVTKLRCAGCDLTGIKANDCKRLVVLYCQENQLENLDLNGCTQLKELYCYKNNLFYEGLTLPKVSAGNLYFNSTEQDDSQKLSPDEIKELTKKNWKVFQKNGSENVLYEGKDYTITMTINLAIGSKFGLYFDEEDLPNVKGADLVASRTEKGLLKNNYSLTSNTVTISGKVTTLNCINLPLKTLNVSENTKLEKLLCGKNGLTNLNLKNNTILTVLSCHNNSLEELDLTKNTKLENLNCSQNGLKKLTLDNNTQLKHLRCSNNYRISNLDISKNEKLETLFCSNIGIEKLNTSKNEALKTLDCSVNKLERLYVHNNKNLTLIICSLNKLTFSNISLPEISKGFFLFTNKFEGDTQWLSPEEVKEINNKGWEVQWKIRDLRWDEYTGDEIIIEMTTKKEFGEEIVLGFNRDDFPVVEGAKFKRNSERNYRFVKVYSLIDNQITIRGKVLSFDCSNENIEKLDVRYNEELQSLNCSKNPIKDLNLSSNKKLQVLKCTNNQLLGSLNLNQNTALKSLECNNNFITELHVNNCTSLVSIYCHNNKLLFKNLNLPKLNDEHRGSLYFREKKETYQTLKKNEVIQLRKINWDVYQLDDQYWGGYNGED